MLITLLAWIYITLLCWLWGKIFIQLIKNSIGIEMGSYHFSFICLTGLSVITVVAAIISLFIPLGNIWVQLAFTIAALFFSLFNRDKTVFKNWAAHWNNLHIIPKILMLCSLLLVAIMSTWKIFHPDTLGYHAQTIQWIEKFRAVPGLVHLHVRFGYQGLWFVDSALFSFSFTGIEGINFLNTSVLTWYLIFIISRLDLSFYKNKNNIIGCLWLALFAFSLWDYTMIRLTAASASPDFIATIFILSVIYLLHQNAENIYDWLIPAFLSIVAITIKLSAVPMALITIAALVVFIKAKRFKLSVVLIGLTLITLTPFIARDIITSGYPVFPSTAIDITSVDWKYNKNETDFEKNYITAYARIYGVNRNEEVNSVMKMKTTEWLPVWCSNLSNPDKIIISLCMISFLIGIIFSKKIIKASYLYILILFTTLSGIIFWFLNAPDPRFGYGFILGFISLILYLVFTKKEIEISQKVYNVMLISLTFIITSYIFYRFKNFFSAENWITPSGIEKNEYKSVECNGIKINSPAENNQFGNTPIPCTEKDCEEFLPRGNKITDGFKAKEIH